MNSEIIFQAWTGDSIWAPWVKPILFAHLSPSMIAGASAASGDGIASTDLNHVSRATGTTAIVVDLPGAASIATGLALAELGYRPIPLYNSVPVILPSANPSLPAAPNPTPEAAQANLDLAVSLYMREDATPGPRVVIDMTPVVRLLVQGSENSTLRALSPHAPPAFLLDSRRRGNGAICRPGDFDNRSISLPTDFPSANFILANRIRTVMVIQEQAGSPEQDLAHTLRRWQEADIRILTSTPGTAPELVEISRPPRFRHMWYGLLARLGLRQNPLGGFGGFLPVASAG